MEPMRWLTRPKTVRAGLMRRALALLLAREAKPGDLRLERLGSDYGGWTIPTNLVGAGWVVYSAGTGHDASFDVEMARRFGATVRAFDPFARNLEGAAELAGGIAGYSQHQLAIADRDGPTELSGDPDPATGSVAAPILGEHPPTFTAEGRSIPSLLAELGDGQIQLLKMDIEGSEYAVLQTIDLSALGVVVLCVELHSNVPLRRALRMLGRIRAQGYALAASKDTDATFVRRAG